MSKPSKRLSSAEVDARIEAIQNRSLVGLPREDQYAELQRRGLSEHLIAKRLEAIAKLELDGEEGNDEWG